MSAVLLALVTTTLAMSGIVTEASTALVHQERQGERTSERDPLAAALAFHRHMAEVVERAEDIASRSATRSVPPPDLAPPAEYPTAEQWAELRQCESNGQYGINTGNGYYGAYQFDIGTWQGVGGTGLPSEASPAEQDMRAQLLYDDRGSQPWPVCGEYLE